MLTEHAELTQSGGIALRSNLAELEIARSRLAGDLEARRNFHREPDAHSLPRLPALPPHFTNEQRVEVMRSYRQQLTDRHTLRPTAFASEEEELKRLDRQIATEQQVLQRVTGGPNNALVRTCETWLAGFHAQANPLPFEVVIDSKLTDLNLELLRAMLPQLAEERRQVAHSPLPINEAKARLQQVIATASAQAPMLSIEPFVSPDYSAGSFTGLYRLVAPRDPDGRPVAAALCRRARGGARRAGAQTDRLL